jgi:hypothetical protein
MKKAKIVLNFVFSLVFLLAGFQLLGADSLNVVLPDPIQPGVEITTLVNWTDLVYAALVTFGGYLGQLIPGINKISNKAFQVVAIGLVLAAIFIILGWSNAIGLVLAYLSATNFYELVLKGVFGKKSPSSAESSQSSVSA